jgi:hypothetical protein
MKKIIPTFEMVVAFLDYPDDFWEFVTPRIRRVDSTIPGNEIFYATLLKFDKKDKNIIRDIKVMVPHIIDLKTACINIHELKHAYDMYIKLNQYVDDNDPTYESTAIEMENKFKEMVYSKK